jgi:large subunit ribosomal protein L11
VEEGSGSQPLKKPRTTASNGPLTAGKLERTIMAKKITGYLKLQVAAGSATGQRGLNIMEFCKAFNAQTAEMEKGAPTPVVITIFADKSFTFELKLPPVTYYLKKATNLKSGSKLPGKESAGTITMAQIREIAEKKLKDLNAYDVDTAASMIAGSARSMGIQVEG